ncbi:Chitin binding domain [Trinorchestia longiramus]|nr:Chitin binding domain [Trinorchestia longiramus]
MVLVLLLLLLSPALMQAQHGAFNKPPMYSAVPDTSFNCANHMAGYYADMETGCQAYHMCDTLGKQYSYLCPNMTVFNQRFMVCDHWHYVNCSNSDQYYDRNARMAGGGKKTHTPGRRSSVPLDNVSANDIDVLNVRKITQLPITHKEIVMKKIINQLRSQDRKETSAGTTTKSTPTARSRTRNEPRTTTPQQKPTKSLTSPLIAARQPIHHFPGGTSSTIFSRTTQISTQRPPTTISALLRRVTHKPSEHRLTTNSLSFTRSTILSTATPAPGKFPSFIARNATSSNGPRLSTREPQSFSTPTHPKIFPFARTSSQPFQFPAKQIHFSQLNNQTDNKSAPAIQMLPGMVARGSGPRFGFGFTNLVRPHSGHLDIPRDPENHPLVLEISRQLLLPKLSLPQSIRQVEDKSIRKDDVNDRRRGNTTTSSGANSRDASPFRFTVINPPNGSGLVSFPVEPFVRSRNFGNSHLAGPGGQQEDITVLEAKKNGRNRPFPKEKFQRPLFSNNQAFFIPETHLIPPDDVLLDQRVNNSSSSPTSNEIGKNFSLPDDTAAHSEDDSHSDHMTMIFPNARTVNFTQTFSGLVVNPNCPECHPAFLTPGECTPCVRIR